MAQDSETPTAADKGKGKAVEKAEDAKKDKEPVVNGKKDDEKDECWSHPCAPKRTKLIHPTLATEELNEEDQQLKNELDMLVERLTVRITNAFLLAMSLLIGF